MTIILAQNGSRSRQIILERKEYLTRTKCRKTRIHLRHRYELNKIKLSPRYIEPLRTLRAHAGIHKVHNVSKISPVSDTQDS